MHRLVSTARARGVAGGNLTGWKSALLVNGLCGIETVSHLVRTGLKCIRSKCSLNAVVKGSGKPKKQNRKTTNHVSVLTVECPLCLGFR